MINSIDPTNKFSSYKPYLDKPLLTPKETKEKFDEADKIYYDFYNYLYEKYPEYFFEINKFFEKSFLKNQDSDLRHPPRMKNISHAIKFLGKKGISDDTMNKYYSEMKKIRDIIIEHNTRMVLNVVKKDYNYDEDIFQAGMIGLMTAFDTFNQNANSVFLTYATPWINQKILMTKKGDSIIKIPSEIKKIISQILELIEKENLSFNEAMDQLLLAEKTKKIIQDIINGTLSLDAPINDDDDNKTTLSKFIPSGERIEEKVRLKENQRVLNSLISEIIPKTSEIEIIRNIIYSIVVKIRFGIFDGKNEDDTLKFVEEYYEKLPKDKEQNIPNFEKIKEIKHGNELSLEEIGIIFSISKERVRQIIKIVLKRIIQKAKGNTKVLNLLQCLWHDTHGDEQFPNLNQLIQNLEVKPKKENS